MTYSTYVMTTMKKIISAFLSILILIESPVFANAMPVPAVSVSRELKTEILNFRYDYLENHFHLDRDLLSPSESHKPLCILIGDAHGSRESQESTLKFIDWIRTYQSNVLFLAEGVHDELHFDRFKAFPEEARKEVSEKWFFRGDLSPIETSFLKNIEDQQVFGAENGNLYEENVKLFWKVKETEKEAKVQLDQILKAIETKLSKTFDPELLKLNSFDSFLSSLGRSPERTFEIFAKLIQKLPLEQLSGFETRFPAFNSFARLTHSVSNKKDPQIDKDLQHWLKNPDLTEQLSKEYPQFYQLLLEGTDISKDVTATWILAQSFYRFISLQATPEDLSSIRQYEKDRKPLANSKVLVRQLELAHAFYKLAEARDIQFQKRFSKVLHENPKTKAMVIVVGGFHMERFRKFLENQKYQYITLKPKMEQPSESDYETRMQKLASLFTSTVITPLVLEENMYAAHGLPGLNRLGQFLTELSAASVRSELRKTQKRPSKLVALVTLFSMFFSFVGNIACNGPVVDWQKVPNALKSDRLKKQREEIIIIPSQIEHELRDSNPIILQRLQVYRAYLEFLKTLPEFANFDLNLAFQTQVDKVIGSINRGKTSKKERIFREKLAELAGAVIGKATEQASGRASDRTTSFLSRLTGRPADDFSDAGGKIGGLVTSVGDQFNQIVTDKITPGPNPDPVNYDPVWGDLGISLGFASSPALSILDALPVEGSRAIPLWGINTPLGFSIGPSSSNLIQGSQNRQAVLNLLQEIVRYRRALDDQTRSVIQLFQALDIANVELLRLVTDAHLLMAQLEQFKTLRSAVSRNEIDRLELELKKTAHLIQIQLRAVSIFQGSLDLFFTRSTKDERTWIAESGGGERSVFTSANNLRANVIRGMDQLPVIPFMKFEQNVFHVDPSQLSELVGELIKKGVIESDMRDWFMSWIRHQTSLQGREISREEIERKAAYAMQNTPDIAATDEIRIQIANTEEGIRQLKVTEHPEVTFGVDAGVTASPIDKVNTWTLGIPLTLSIKFPISVRNTEVSIQQNRADIEMSRIGIDEALKSRRDTQGTLLDTIQQTSQRRKFLEADQAQRQSLLGEFGRTLSDYKGDASQPIPAAVQKQYLDFVRDMIGIRAQLHGAEADNYWTYQLLVTYLGNGHVRGNDYPQNQMSPSQFDPNVKTIIEKGTRPRSELRSKLENEDQVVSQIQEKLNLYSDILSDKGEITFAGSKLSYEKTEKGIKLIKAKMPLLKYFDISFVLILIEEYLHELALLTHANQSFANEVQRDYALFQNTLLRITKRIISDGLSSKLSNFLPRENDNFLVLRVLKNSVNSIQAQDDSEIRSIIWSQLQAEANQPQKPAKRVIHIPASNEISEALAGETDKVLPVYKTALYAAVGLGDLATRELIEDRDAVDSDQRGIFGFIRDFSAGVFPQNISTLLLHFKPSEVKILTQKYEIPVEKLNQETLSLLKKGNEAALRELNAVQPPQPELEEQVIRTISDEDKEDVESLDASDGDAIISMDPVEDDANLVLVGASNESSSGLIFGSLRSFTGTTLKTLSFFFLSVLALLSTSFASPTSSISAGVSVAAIKQVIPASQPTATQPAIIVPPAPKIIEQKVSLQKSSPESIKPWVTNFPSLQISLNPNIPVENSKADLAQLLAAAGSQVPTYAVRIPGAIAIQNNGDKSNVSWEEALGSLTTRFESLKQQLSEQDTEFGKDESPLLPVPFHVSNWLETLKASETAILQVSPAQNGDDKLRGTIIPWDELVADAFLKLSQAERELDTFLRGDSSSGDFRIFLVNAYNSLIKLAEAMERYQKLHVVFADKEDLKNATLNLSDLTLRSNNFDSKYFVTVKLKEGLSPLAVDLVLSRDGKQEVVQPKDVDWIALGGNVYIGIVKTKAPASNDFSEAVVRFKKADRQTEPWVSVISESDFNYQRISAGRGLKAELKVSYFQKVHVGDVVAVITDPAVQQEINRLEREVNKLENKRKVLNDNLPFISSNVVQSEYGVSRDQIDNKIAELNKDIAALKQLNVQIPVKATQEGILLPPGFSKAFHAAYDDYLIGLVAPVIQKDELRDEPRSELRHSKTAELLRDTIANQSKFDLPLSQINQGNSPFSSTLNHMQERNSFVHTLNQFSNLRSELRLFAAKANPIQSETTLLITDAASFSYKNFEKWRNFLPPANRLHWIVIASREELNDPAFHQFKNMLRQNGYFLTVATSARDAYRYIERQSKLWQPDLIKWISGSDVRALPMSVNHSSEAIVVKFNARVYSEFETWFYRLILEAPSASRLASTYQSVRSSKEGVWTVLEFDFTRLIQELAGDKTLLRSA